MGELTRRLKGSVPSLQPKEFHMHFDILVLGGGASGMMAALAAKQTAPGAAVAIVEALPRLGKKLLATGNGRCNLMNDLALPASYTGDADFAAPALSLYRKSSPALWSGLGLRLMREDEGRVYPATNQASSVLDVLRLALRERGIEEITGARVTSLSRVRGGLKAQGEGFCHSASRVILATGGLAGKGLGENDSFQRLLTPLGHRITPLYPALTCLKTARQDVAGLKGVRLRGEIRLLMEERCLMCERGEVLFQEDGLSGIAAMQLSIAASPLLKQGRRLSAMLSPLPDEAKSEVERRVRLYPERSAEELMTGAVNRLIGLLALKRSGISPSRRAGTLSPGEVEALSRELTKWEIRLVGTGDFSQAQVMLGGADTEDFDPATLRSRRVPELYAAGELLNITGPCGGYNLEWAWASGMLAGQAAARSL